MVLAVGEGLSGRPQAGPGPALPAWLHRSPSCPLHSMRQLTCAKCCVQELQSRSLCPGARGKEVSVGTGAQAGPPTSGCPGRRPRPSPEPRPRAAGFSSRHLQAPFVTCETGGHLVLRVPRHASLWASALASMVLLRP